MGALKAHCSFCGMDETEAGRLVEGPAVYICKGCAELALDVLAQPPRQERSRPYSEFRAEVKARLDREASDDG